MAAALPKPPTASARRLRDTQASFRLDSLVAASAEVFRESRWARDYSIGDVAETAFAMEEDLPNTNQVGEFLGLLTEAARLER